MNGVDYIIKTERLGLRPWHDDDIPLMTAINQDKDVMRFFPALSTEQETHEFVKRMQTHYEQYGFCYFAVDRLDTGGFIGFIGLLHQTFESHFTPCVDIGWRIKKEEWNKGFATEGATACLNFAFDKLHITEVYAIAPKKNEPSEKVMKKIGMMKKDEFEHPKLLAHSELKTCVLYLKQNN